MEISPTAEVLPTRPGARSFPPWASLLEKFYRNGERLPPRLEVLHGVEMPQPYRDLLVHSADMTPTLEHFHGRALGLRVLSRRREGGSYLREVVLTVSADSRPVVYGAIRIWLEDLPPTARQQVLEEARPLGKILEREGIPHLSWPQAFFRVQPDAHMAANLGLAQPVPTYGRRNVLLDGNRRLLADVIEVLAPVETPASVRA